MKALDTFPKILLDNAKRIGKRPSIREKDLGIWQTWTWADVAEEVRALACGLADMGFQRGDKLIIIGANRPRMYWTMAAVQSLGGVPVPTYHDAVADEMQYVIDHAEARFVMAEDQEQVDKVLEVKERCPAVEQIIFDDPRGLRDYDEPFLHDFESVQARGREYDKQHPKFFLEQVEQGDTDDICIMLYTSGTTGRPKGVVLSNSNLVAMARNGAQLEKLNQNEEVLAYLPLAWIGDFVFSYGQSYTTGFCVNCPESAETVMANMREVGPTYYFAPPRIFENLLTNVMIRMEDSSKLKKRLFHYFIGVAKDVGVRILDGQEVSSKERWLYRLGNYLVYAPLKDALGMGRVKVAYTAGEAIGPEIFSFYRSLGINLKQIYGQTEASIFVTVQPDGQIYPETVGVAAPGVDVKINDDGEVMYSGIGVFQYYYKNPESTAKTKTEDNWVYTGDAGFFTRDGHLRIIDRAKDVGKFNDGKMFAPKFLENKLKFYPHIREAVTFGDKRDFCTAFINIDMQAVGNWAEQRSLAYASYQELASMPEVYEMIRESVETVNESLLDDEMLAHSQINRFLILHKELDADDGELTRTNKVRRAFIAERYEELLDALYGGKDECFIETKISYEDGRSGVISGNIKIKDAKTFDAAK